MRVLGPGGGPYLYFSGKHKDLFIPRRVKMVSPGVSRLDGEGMEIGNVPGVFHFREGFITYPLRSRWSFSVLCSIFLSFPYVTCSSFPGSGREHAAP